MSTSDNKKQKRLPQFYGQKPNSKGKKPKVPPLKQQIECLKLEKSGLKTENTNLTQKLESMTKELDCYKSEDMMRIQNLNDQVYIPKHELASWNTRIAEYVSEIDRLNEIISKPVEEPIYKCEVCEIEFDNSESLTVHILNDHYRTLYEAFRDERKEKEDFKQKYNETLAENKLLQNKISIESTEAKHDHEGQPLEISTKNSTSENGILIMFYEKHITR